MLRLFAAQAFYEVCKYSHSLASCVNKRQVVNFLSVSSVCHHKLYTLTRHLSIGSATWKDALQPKTDKTIELDKWKAVMRSKTVLEGKQISNDVEGDDENLGGPGGDLKDSSPLDATRELVAMWQQAGKLVPQEMTDEELQTLAELTTKSSRRKYLKYLAIKEGYKRSRKKKQEQRAERKALMKTELDNNTEGGDDQREQEPKNKLILQFWNRSLDKVLAWRSAQAMLFDQPLVFDMSYESNMSKQEIENTVSQLMEVEAWNRRATEPFHLHYCNLQPEGAYMRELLKRYGTKTWDQLLVTSTDCKHVDLFPSEQLVYLTADSPNVLHSFDHSKIYIVGAIVDRSIKSGLSMANAKCLKLTTARLPLDEFLYWETGAKNLTLDQMIRIMLTLKQTGNWQEALKFVPKRKHDGFHQHREKDLNKNRVRGLINHGPNSDGPLRFGERSGESTFTNVYRSVYTSQKEPGLTGQNKNKFTASRVRLSFKSNKEERKSAGKKWLDE